MRFCSAGLRFDKVWAFDDRSRESSQIHQFAHTDMHNDSICKRFMLVLWKYRITDTVPTRTGYYGYNDTTEVVVELTLINY